MDDSLGSAKLAEMLARTPLLADFDAAELRALAVHLRPCSFDAGAAVITQAETDRCMYICLSGRAQVERGGMVLQNVEPGSHFGEFGLVARTPRAARVVARSKLLLARLDLADYEALHDTEPLLGRKLLEAITRSAAQRLGDITDSVRHLLHERSQPRRRLLDVRVMGRPQSVHPGTPLSGLLPDEVDGHWVVAALLDHKPVALTAGVSASCAIEALTTGHWEGRRIYRRSLGLLLLEAAHRLDPGVRVELGLSVGFAQRVQLSDGDPERLTRLAVGLRAEMKAIAAGGATLREEWWTLDEAREWFDERGIGAVAALLSTWRAPAVPLVSYGHVYALHLGPVVPEANRLEGFTVERDETGLLLLYGEHSATRPVPRETLRPLSTPPPTDRVDEARSVSRQTGSMTALQDPWLSTLGIDSVGQFNRVCIDGSVPELIRVNEGFHEKAIGIMADLIAARHDRVRIVCIAGPSSSGKTTFIKRLSVQLRVNGIRPVGISLDDYYVDREQTPLDAQGEYDFEALEALDAARLADDLAGLLRGEPVRLPRYDFPAGRSIPDGGPELTLGESDVLMLEGIHGLNPSLLQGALAGATFRVFICPLRQLPFDGLSRVHASDLRLLRRIVRDRHRRGIDAEQNILRWPSVRAGERRHIFPHQHSADAVFDSSLVYELSVLRVYGERYLLEVPQDSPAYPTAFRLLTLLDYFVAIYPDHVPPTSIIREFIGESGFEY